MKKETIEKILAFRDARDWRKFHNGKDLALSLSLEASELLEIYQWSGGDLNVEHKLELIKEELADIIMYSILIADRYKLDVDGIVLQKLNANEAKYPVEKAKGTYRKYTELDDE